jgi:hypothetical protein
MPLNYRNRQAILDKNPEIGQALDDLLRHVQTTMDQTNASPDGQAQPPTAPAALKVTAAHGIFDASITDNSPVTRGVNYFLEYSQSPQFNSPTVVDLGQSRNHRVMLGNQNLYWRAYSAYPTGPKSAHVYHGGVATPSPVAGGGSLSGPSIQPSQGSGTSYGANGADGGFGNNSRRVKP